MEYIFSFGVIGFYLLVVIIINFFYKLTEKKSNLGTVFSVIALIMIFVFGMVFYGMIFDTKGYEYFAKSDIAYIMLGIFIFMKTSLFISIFFQMYTLKPKRKIKLIKE